MELSPKRHALVDRHRSGAAGGGVLGAQPFDAHCHGGDQSEWIALVAGNFGVVAVDRTVQQRVIACMEARIDQAG